MFETVPVRRIARHVVFWIVYILYEVLLYGWSDLDRFQFLATHEFWLDLPMMLLIVYVNLYALMPAFLSAKKYLSYGVSLFLVLLLGGCYSRYIGYKVWLPWDQTHFPLAFQSEPKHFFVPIRIVRNTLNFYPVVALTMLIKVLRNSLVREKGLREAEAARHQAELSFLKAQIHPHFFFNTLNSLYALTQKGSRKSSEMVLRLSGVMHYMLYESNGDRVGLDQEIAHLKDYIAIEELRFADRLDVSFQCTGNQNGKTIAPLLLLPFVENAVKHSLSQETGRARIRLELSVEGEELVFGVVNSYKEAPVASPHRGVGLDNVKKRLRLTYPSHQLTVHTTADTFSVQLKLALDEKN
jgi:two-component system, LytTR family, sensor kinase